MHNDKGNTRGLVGANGRIRRQQVFKELKDFLSHDDELSADLESLKSAVGSMS